jgi:hypothetical protein
VPRHNAYRNGRVHVCDRLCDTCIFKPSQEAIPKERVDGMVAESIRNDSAIVCHSTLNTKPKKNSVCRGFYENHGGESLSLRAAMAFELIEFVPPPSK